jgi:ribosomal protein L5
MNLNLNNQLSYNRLYEKKIDVNDLCFITKFIKNNRQVNLKANKFLLNFSFKEINFNKKRVAPFLLILEILSNQRNTAMKSKKNIIYLNIKKNTFVGCKVTLRENNIYEFLDTMLLYLPQLENIDLIKQQELNKNKFNNFSF